jgi:hypothetical protein
LWSAISPSLDIKIIIKVGTIKKNQNQSANPDGDHRRWVRPPLKSVNTESVCDRWADLNGREVERVEVSK